MIYGFNSSQKMNFVFWKGEFTPKKYFSIDRVFRNEAVDRTHLAEFHQIEGINLLFSVRSVDGSNIGLVNIA